MTPGQSPSAVRRAGPPADESEVAPHGVGFLLGVAHRARRRAWEADLADLDLTAPQAAVLRRIAAQPGSGVRRLARAVAHRAQRAEQDLIDALNAERYHALLAGLQTLVDHDRRTLGPTNRISHGARSDETP